MPSFREREKNAKIIGSCEYLIGDPSISISIPKVFLRLHLFTPSPKKKEEEEEEEESKKNSQISRHKKIIIIIKE